MRITYHSVCFMMKLGWVVDGFDFWFSKFWSSNFKNEKEKNSLYPTVFPANRMSGSESEKKGIPWTTSLLVSANRKASSKNRNLPNLEARNLRRLSKKSPWLSHQIPLSSEKLISALTEKQGLSEAISMLTLAMREIFLKKKTFTSYRSKKVINTMSFVSRAASESAELSRHEIQGLRGPGTSFS